MRAKLAITNMIDIANMIEVVSFFEKSRYIECRSHLWVTMKTIKSSNPKKYSLGNRLRSQGFELNPDKIEMA